MSDKQKLYLRKLSRKIWSFFDAYAGAEDNWLPPDNIQEMPTFTSPTDKLANDGNVTQKPEIVVAHRTSPTNIGLALLSYLAANDFGYIPASHLITRLSNTFGSMALPGPFLQLVRYQNAPATPEPDLYFFRRQRQSGRSSDYIEGRTGRTEKPDGPDRPFARRTQGYV